MCKAPDFVDLSARVCLFASRSDVHQACTSRAVVFFSLHWLQCIRKMFAIPRLWAEYLLLIDVWIDIWMIVAGCINFHVGSELQCSFDALQVAKVRNLSGVHAPLVLHQLVALSWKLILATMNATTISHIMVFDNRRKNVCDARCLASGRCATPQSWPYSSAWFCHFWDKINVVMEVTWLCCM